MTTYTLTELFSKRAEIAGQIVQAEKQARQLRADLAHVEATIRILRPGTELPKIVPKRVEFRPRYFKRGQLTRLIRDHLREHAGEAVAVADIMPAAVGDRNLNSAEYRRVEFRPRYFKRGQLTRLIRDHLREHAGQPVAVADIMPAAVGDRNLNSVEYRRVEIVVYEALKKLTKRGTVRQTGQGPKLARWTLAPREAERI